MPSLLCCTLMPR
uniref:Uncharacterized protein n=1 Tax=Arundo donax TaxID=35708 RepID=A0A0A9BE72_ARUDO